MITIKKISIMVLLVTASLGLAQSDEERVLSFEKVLEHSAPSEKSRMALWHLYQRLPENTSHEKRIKAIAAENFRKKYNMNIEEVKKAPEPVVVEQADPAWYQKYMMALIKSGVGVLPILYVTIQWMRMGRGEAVAYEMRRLHGVGGG